MTDAVRRAKSERPKRRVGLLDTVAVRGVVWLALALVLIAPIAVMRLLPPAPVRQAPITAVPTNRTALPTPIPAPMLPPSPPAATSTAPSNAVPHASAADVRDRLAAILSAYQSRDDFGTPESAMQAASALHWCAQQLAVHEHISAPDASSALSAALTEPRSPEGLRVVSAIEAPAQGADDTSRMHCASLLYAQLEH